METFGLYLLKSAVWLTGFTLVYLTVLRNERYFRLNRIYLLSGILASMAFPLYTWHYAVIIPSTTGIISISNLSAKVIDTQRPALPYYFWLYAVGIGWLVFRLIWQTVKVIRKLHNAGYEVAGSVKLVRTPDYAASFSFFSYVFVNPSTSDVETREIVNHESEHIEQRHWFDLLLAEILCMVQWFNPFVWIYAHLIRQNHEYLADEKALLRTSDPAIYRATLLNQLIGVPVISLGNSFSYSLNKKRFKMMKKSIHSPYRRLRLLMVMPLMALVFYAFAKPQYISVPETKSDFTNLTNLTNDTREGKTTIKGTVMNPEGKPLAGTSVILKGSTIGTTTDENGKFILTDVPKDGELVFSYIGYDSAVTKVDNVNPMTIKLALTSVGIKEVVVSGNDAPPPPPLPTSGNTKGNLLFVDSKENSITFGDPKKDPLIYVDGKVTDYNTMRGIKPELIESINVLKDKTATDKYGEKGKNGVILITSKKSVSKEQKSKISSDVKQKDGNVFTVVEEMPQYEGGFNALMKFIGDNVRYPAQAKADKIQGTVIVNFIIRSSGKVENVGIERSVNLLLDKEAARVITILPDWKPGKQQGKAVDVSYTIPIQFKLDGPEGKKVTDVNNIGIFDGPEVMPVFPGGDKALQKFIGENVKYPAKALKDTIQGMVVVNFNVLKSGKMDNIKVIRSVSPELDNEALRVIGLMPDWKPGEQNGKVSDMQMTIPIKFKLR